MMAAFSRAIFVTVSPEPVHVVEVDVGHDRHPAVPGVGRIEPPAETDLDQRDVRTDLREAREDDGGQQLELGRVAVAAGDPVRDGQHPPDQPGEVVRRRSAVRRPGSVRGT